jgi:hypothetical protein
LKRGLLARRITVAASTVDPVPVARRFTVAMAVDLARLAWDTARGRTRIDRAGLVPAQHSTLADPGMVMRDTGP